MLRDDSEELKDKIDLAFRPPKKVVFTGDFMRPSVAGDRPTQHHNIRWLQNLVSSQIKMAADLPQEVLSWGVAGVHDGRLTSTDITSFYNFFGLPLDIRSWAMIFQLDQLPARLENFLLSVFEDSLVVAFELPPYVEHFLNRHAIPFIAATIHPVRFLDDIFLAVRSNIPAAQEQLFKYRVDESYIRTIAGIQKASAARNFKDTAKQNSAIFLLQTWYDQSQIENGRFIDASIYIDEIADLANQYSEFLVKEHPLAPNPATVYLQSRIPNLRMVTGNVYGYMSMPEIRMIATISSSVGTEAPYFGVDSKFFLGTPVKLRLDAEDDADRYVGIVDAYLAPDFWRNMLATVMPVTKHDGVTVPFKPNRLRISLRSFWNFNEIDTDVTSGLGR